MIRNAPPVMGRQAGQGKTKGKTAMKLYVGTYAKYNNGDLSGAWLDLDRFANAEEFEAACKRIHRDERDPELMFQDVETDPGCDWQEGLYCESSIPRDYWTLRAEFAAKENDAEPKGAAAQRAEQARLMEIYIERDGYSRSSRWYDGEVKYHKGRSFFVELADGSVLRIERPTIQTQFCCGEDDRGQGGEGPGTVAYAHKVLEGKRTEAGFKAANLDPFDKRMVHVAGRRAWRFARTGGAGAETCRGDFVPGLMRGTTSASMRVYFGNAANVGRSEEVVRIFTDEDMRRMRRGYMAVRRDFRRRLNAYWKRFGASKIHTWTYWTEA